MRRVPLAPCEVLQTCARVLVHCYARHTAFCCDANNMFVHARAPAHRPQSRTPSFVRRSAKEVTSSSAELHLKGYHQTRIEQPTERGRNLASAPIDPLVLPNFRRWQNGTANLQQPSVDDKEEDHPQATTFGRGVLDGSHQENFHAQFSCVHDVVIELFPTTAHAVEFGLSRSQSTCAHTVDFDLRQRNPSPFTVGKSNSA